MYSPELRDKLAEAYRSCPESNMRERLFRLLMGLINRDPKQNVSLLGEPGNLRDLDLSGLDFSGLPLTCANFAGSILPETDLRRADLRKAVFEGAILNHTMLDGANLASAKFVEAEVQSIFVFAEFDSKASMMLEGKRARQWLFSRGAMVKDQSELNPLFGKPWYEAAREVTKTLEHRIAGTHQDSSLAKGTSLKYRGFARDFVKYLRSCGMLQDVKRSRKGSRVVKVNPDHRQTIREFSEDGTIAEVLQNFFDKYEEKGEE